MTHMLQRGHSSDSETTQDPMGKVIGYRCCFRSEHIESWRSHTGSEIMLGKS